MGFIASSVSIIRYRVRGEIEGSFWDVVDLGITNGAFREIETASDEIGIGWTSIDDFTDTTFRSSYVRGNYVAVSLRVDSARIPPRVLEIELKKEARKILEQTGAHRLSATQNRDLKDHLKESLKKRVFPSIQVYDLIWDTAKSIAFFGSHSPKARERVEQHFKKCFGLTLVPLIPFIRAEEILAENPEKQRLESLRPAIMAP